MNLEDKECLGPQHVVTIPEIVEEVNDVLHGRRGKINSRLLAYILSFSPNGCRIYWMPIKNVKDQKLSTKIWISLTSSQ